ncbi:hypothetical protein B0H63DRAFT_531200 [Podospora didyma]|uniref:Uncharacterized protein n=1 Tax=Podospora didyma TaxID=330526 RepID=A0AAE0P4Y6_9PEZI|nr:hypothetical protein B0H63DRAFT_531200 [Podospora didyma]
MPQSQTSLPQRTAPADLLATEDARLEEQASSVVAKPQAPPFLMAPSLAREGSKVDHVDTTNAMQVPKPPAIGGTSEASSSRWKWQFQHQLRRIDINSANSITNITIIITLLQLPAQQHRTTSVNRKIGLKPRPSSIATETHASFAGLLANLLNAVLGASPARLSSPLSAKRQKVIQGEKQPTPESSPIVTFNGLPAAVPTNQSWQDMVLGLDDNMKNVGFVDLSISNDESEMPDSSNPDPNRNALLLLLVTCTFSCDEIPESTHHLKLIEHLNSEIFWSVRRYGTDLSTRDDTGLWTHLPNHPPSDVLQQGSSSQYQQQTSAASSTSSMKRSSPQPSPSWMFKRPDPTGHRRRIHCDDVLELAHVYDSIMALGPNLLTSSLSRTENNLDDIWAMVPGIVRISHRLDQRPS